MKTYIDSNTRGQSAAIRAGQWLGRLQSGLSGLRESFRKTRQRRLAIRDLRSLSDRTLNDIGIDRSQIPEVVDGLLARNHGTGARVSRELNTSLSAVPCHEGCPA